jgi:hypothetical protein
LLNNFINSTLLPADKISMFLFIYQFIIILNEIYEIKKIY